jgi:squalene synthase HpnC
MAAPHETTISRPPAGARAVMPPRGAEDVRAGENFPVALRVLPAATRRHLLALYAYARYVDDLGDEPLRVSGDGSPAARLAALDAVEAGVRDLYAGRPVHHPVLGGLAATVRERNLPMAPLLRLVEANRVDQRRSAYGTFAELMAYCDLSANPVGELVLHVFGRATPERVALSDRICTALQLVEHLQDVAEDHRRGRVYLPVEDLNRFRVRPDELSRPPARHAVRDLVAFEAERAAAWLESGAPLVATLRGWARPAVGGYLAGGRAALDALARSGYDPVSGPPKAGRRDVLRRWVLATVRSAG